MRIGGLVVARIRGDQVCSLMDNRPSVGVFPVPVAHHTISTSRLAAPVTCGLPQRSQVPPSMSGSQPSCSWPQALQKPGLSVPNIARLTAFSTRLRVILLFMTGHAD